MFSTIQDVLSKVAPTTQSMIVYMLTAMVAWVIYELFLESPPRGAENVLYVVLGALLNTWTAAISYFVGTTKSGTAKTDALVHAINK